LIDVYWNNLNKLVDRLRLFDASRRADNNAHNNKIIEEANLIIN